MHEENDTTHSATDLPSIADLGKMLAALDVALEAVTTFERGQPIAADRAGALRDLIATMQPRTFADAAVVIACAVSIASRLDHKDASDQAGHEVRKLERMLLSVLPIVTEAAGLDPGQMGWTVLEERRASMFGEGLEYLTFAEAKSRRY